MLLANIAVEFDCAPHWSVQLPIYYSGFNYFTSRRKFRTFAIIPEARYWFRSDNQGWFAGAHLGMAYYNIALGGTTRYQDLSAEASISATVSGSAQRAAGALNSRSAPESIISTMTNSATATTGF